MYGKINRIHFVGIGGIGMSGIAEVLVNMGYRVTGSDIKQSPGIQRLQDLGVEVFIGHDSNNVGNTDVVVTSSAIIGSNPEVEFAIANKIPVIARAEMLAELMRLKFGIAVVGSHGKTTTTSMISSVLFHGDLDPTIVVGGKVKKLGSNARLGKGKFMVVEADESDGSFQKLSPVISVLTNIDLEHIDHYENIENLEAEFARFLDKIPFYGLSVLCADCPRVRKLESKYNKRHITYGHANDADLTIRNVRVSGFNTFFNVSLHGELLGEIELNVAGRHNALNSLAAVAVGLELGMSFEDIKKGLYEFSGIDRRLQLKGNKEGIMVIDDYGHHPSELKTTIESLEESFSRKPVVVFQPHRFSRTKLLFNEFVEVLSNVNKLYVLDIYPAGEKPLEGTDSKILVEAIRATGKNDTQYVDNPDKLIGMLKKKISSGDIVLTSGAGNVWIYGEKLLEELS